MEHLWRSQYPRNIPARHPRSVLSEFGIGTRRVGEFHVGGCVLLNAPSRLIGNRERLSGNVTRKLFERWSGMREAREMFRDCCIAKRSTKDPDYFTERRAKFLPWSGYLISQLRRLRSEFRNATRTYYVGFKFFSLVWLERRGKKSSPLLFFSWIYSKHPNFRSKLNRILAKNPPKNRGLSFETFGRKIRLVPFRKNSERDERYKEIEGIQRKEGTWYLYIR